MASGPAAATRAKTAAHSHSRESDDARTGAGQNGCCRWGCGGALRGSEPSRGAARLRADPVPARRDIEAAGHQVSCYHPRLRGWGRDREPLLPAGRWPGVDSDADSEPGGRDALLVRGTTDRRRGRHLHRKPGLRPRNHRRCRHGAPLYRRTPLPPRVRVRRRLRSPVAVAWQRRAGTPDLRTRCLLAAVRLRRLVANATLDHTSSTGSPSSCGNIASLPEIPDGEESLWGRVESRYLAVTCGVRSRPKDSMWCRGATGTPTRWSSSRRTS